MNEIKDIIPTHNIAAFSRITSVEGEKKPIDDDEATSAALSPSSSSSYSSTCLPLEVRYLRQYALENNDWHEFQVRQSLKYTQYQQILALILKLP